LLATISEAKQQSLIAIKSNAYRLTIVGASGWYAYSVSSLSFLVIKAIAVMKRILTGRIARFACGFQTFKRSVDPSKTNK
jgi:hypothetical protein